MATTPIDLLSARFAPIQQCILCYLDVGATIALTKTCRALDVRSLLNHTIYNIDRHLKWWFKKPTEFRTLQRDLGFLLTRYFAVAFLAGDLDPRAFLDLVIKRVQFPRLRVYLESEGYSL